MASKLEKEANAWIDDVPVEFAECYLELTEVKKKDSVATFEIGEEGIEFTVTFPADYPKNGNEFFVFSEDASMQDWMESVNNSVKAKTSISDLLSICCAKFSGGGEPTMKDIIPPDERMIPGQEKVKSGKQEVSEAEKQIDSKMAAGAFLDIGSPQATLRILKDLKSIAKQDSKSLGFTAAPVTVDGQENLYHWNIQLRAFDDKSDLAKDIAQIKKKTKEDFVTLEMRFSKDYPHVPPFVRVVRPRFAFRTGHVTIGGSICMQLLTKSGWNPANDIESILIQIMAELTSGGARLDLGQNNSYSEHEAWEAFYRAARTHNWDVQGLGKHMFPEVKKS